MLELRGGPITAAEQWVFRHGTIVGGAFPSSHVAVAFVAACFAIRFSVIPAVLVPLSIGLAISTVYAGYHYGVDVLYGMIVGAVVAATSGKAVRLAGEDQNRPVGSGRGRPGPAKIGALVICERRAARVFRSAVKCGLVGLVDGVLRITVIYGGCRVGVHQVLRETNYDARRRAGFAGKEEISW